MHHFLNEKISGTWLSIIIFLFCIYNSPASGSSNKDWFICTYGGVLGDNILTEIVYSPNLTDSRMFAVGFGRKILQNRNYVRLEFEGQVVRHTGQGKFICECEACGNPGWAWADGQSYEISRDLSIVTHYEMNGVLVLRWLKFPFERYIDIDFAAGEGFSYATEPPPIEVDPHSVNHGDDYYTSRWLNYLMFELTFSLPRYPFWSFFYRVHHRSGNFGLINGVANGSNVIGLGLRHEF